MRTVTLIYSIFCYLSQAVFYTMHFYNFLAVHKKNSNFMRYFRAKIFLLFLAFTLKIIFKLIFVSLVNIE